MERSHQSAGVYPVRLADYGILSRDRVGVVILIVIVSDRGVNDRGHDRGGRSPSR